jgi:hypothetical protein
LPLTALLLEDLAVLVPAFTSRSRLLLFAPHPVSIFSSASAIFIKLERRSWFFDEAGWLEIPPVGAQPIAEAERDEVEAGLVTIR